MLALIRSKGFLWLSNSHSQIFYWALAGKHFELKQYGMWWASVAEEEWPLDEKERQEIRKDFDASADGLGDRRQEVVFIGVRWTRRRSPRSSTPASSPTPRWTRTSSTGTAATTREARTTGGRPRAAAS